MSVPNSPQQHKQLEANFFSCYSHYVGEGCGTVNVELIERFIENLKKGKASGLDSLIAEHVSFAHRVLIVHLSLLFRIMLKHSLVPDAFGRSVVIPLLKNPDGNKFTSEIIDVLHLAL